MARTEVYFYRDERGSLPLIRWLDELPSKARLKCTDRISRLAQLGNELRPLRQTNLRDGIYELRASCEGVQYRLLYFFSGRAVVVLSHGLTKEREVPKKEIERAIERKKKVETDFRRHAFKPD